MVENNGHTDLLTLTLVNHFRSCWIGIANPDPIFMNLPVRKCSVLFISDHWQHRSITDTLSIERKASLAWTRHPTIVAEVVRIRDCSRERPAPRYTSVNRSRSVIALVGSTWAPIDSAFECAATFWAARDKISTRKTLNRPAHLSMEQRWPHQEQQWAQKGES